MAWHPAAATALDTSNGAPGSPEPRAETSDGTTDAAPA